LSTTSRRLTVLLSPESAHGPTNQCIGIGNILLQRGHRVVFAAESSWKGRLEPLGFEEQLVDLADPAPTDDEQDAGAFWTEFIRDTAPEFRKPTIEQLATFIRPTWEALIAGSQYCEPRLREILEAVQPDVVVEDNVVCFPALLTSEAPFVRIVSCNPLEVPDEGSAPTFSGLPHDDRAEWAGFRAEYDRTHREVWASFNEWVVAQGAPALPDLAFMHESEHANLYVYPAEADYDRVRPLGDTWHRIDSSVRETDDDYVLPPAVADRPEGSALVYLSLGSLGGADVELMRRLVDVLGRTAHRFVVSKGPMGDLIELPDNMVGESSVPQTKVIPAVDLVITHGGNNTTTEALHFGKPMVVLPLFWDQYDNAQRMHELGFGVRLDTYSFSDGQLIDAVDDLLADVVLRARSAEIGRRIRARQGLRAGADIIERVARAHADGQTPGRPVRRPTDQA
jgi:MGT family glycosyltransferase